MFLWLKESETKSTPWLSTNQRNSNKDDKVKSNGTKEINWSYYQRYCLNIANKIQKISKRYSV